jgi:pimeloyl-ACP methyl ester carboxylesterase
MEPTRDTPSPVILVPGYWLGAWAWDAVAERLRAVGHPVTAVTLPGLESAATPRTDLHFADHVDAVLRLLPASGGPAVLVAHSGAGAVATAVLDAAPERVSRVVYVDSGPTADGTVPRPDLPAEAVELPLPAFEDLESGGASLEGLDDETLRAFRRHAVPHPAGPIREPVVLGNPRRDGVPATLVCCSLPSETVRGLVAAGEPMFAAVAELANVDYVDLPTGHWPMWSRPDDLAEVIAAAARR